MNLSLYFFALLPEKSFSEKVCSIQEELREEFGLKYAMRIPAHITLIAPFQCRKSEESKLISCIKEIKPKLQPITLKSKNFGSFIESVVYIELIPSKELERVHQWISDTLEMKGFLTPGQRSNDYIPHITLAHRDLDQNLFPEIWNKLSAMSLEESFAINRLVVFRHDDSIWKEFVSLPISLAFA